MRMKQKEVYPCWTLQHVYKLSCSILATTGKTGSHGHLAQYCVLKKWQDGDSRTGIFRVEINKEAHGEGLTMLTFSSGVS